VPTGDIDGMEKITKNANPLLYEGSLSGKTGF
jgi:hypothetical protein